MNVDAITTAVRESYLTSVVTLNQEFVDISLEWAVAVTEVADNEVEVELWHWTGGESVYMTLTDCNTIREVVDGAVELVLNELEGIRKAA